jgi:hypothetical protein
MFLMFAFKDDIDLFFSLKTRISFLNKKYIFIFHSIQRRKDVGIFFIDNEYKASVTVQLLSVTKILSNVSVIFSLQQMF